MIGPGPVTACPSSPDNASRVSSCNPDLRRPSTRANHHLVRTLVRWRDWNRCRHRLLLSPQTLDEHKVARNEENAENGGDQHAPEDRGAHDVLRAGARSACEHERYKTQDEGECGHEYSAKD